MGNDFAKDLLKDYKKKNTFNVFVNKYYLATDELKSMSNLQKIVRIETNKNTYFSALTKNNASIFATPNKDDFLQELANGIFRAVNALYEKEKRNSFPSFGVARQKR